MTQLHRYLSRLQDMIISRQEIQIVTMEIIDRSQRSGQSSEFYAVLRFPDTSELQVSEKLIVENYALRKTRYAYHYQESDNSLIFRYDNAPHHQDVPTFPHHKHEQEQIVSAQPPDLGDVLREIDAIIYKGR